MTLTGKTKTLHKGGGVKIGKYKLQEFDSEVVWISQGNKSIIAKIDELEEIIGIFYNSQLLEKDADIQGWEEKL